MKYAFHPEALTEYAESVQYYMEQRVEVAQAFIDAVEDAIYRIRESPTRYLASRVMQFKSASAYYFTRGAVATLSKLTDLNKLCQSSATDAS
jgi:hypothetical protein